MWIRKLFFSVLLLSCGWLQAQTVWPAVQSNMYPHIPFMKLVRHEQTVLLGEGKDGRSNFSKLFTMTDLIGSVGSGTYQANQADMSLLNGTESTNALLQKMLEEGRLVVQ